MWKLYLSEHVYLLIIYRDVDQTVLLLLQHCCGGLWSFCVISQAKNIRLNVKFVQFAVFGTLAPGSVLNFSSAAAVYSQSLTVVN